VEFGVGQDPSDARSLGSRCDDREQIRALVRRAAARDRRQQKLLTQICHDHPVSGYVSTAAVFARDNACAAQKRADRALCQTRRIDRYPSFSSATAL
jgi:hypothetical protein